MKILFLTHRLPYAPNRGDRIRAYYLLREMTRWSEVHLISLVHDPAEQAQAATMRGPASVTTARTSPWRSRVGALIGVASSRPLTHVFLDASTLPALIDDAMVRVRPDLILAYCSGMARFAMAHARRGMPFVLDMVDVDSEKWRELGASTSGPRRLLYVREARTLGAFEVQACRAAAATLVVNERERRLLERRAPGANVHIMPVGVDLETFRQRPRDVATDTVVFCGVFDYAPNISGAVWLAKQVWPLVRAKRPAARLVLVGANPARAVRALAAEDATIEVTGSVPDVAPYLWKASVAAAPLQIARGVQTKVLEAVAAGLPTVITRAVAEGLPTELQPACVVADQPKEFARRLLELLAAPAGARAAMMGGIDIQRLSWQRQLTELQPILECAARTNRNARPCVPC